MKKLTVVATIVAIAVPSFITPRGAHAGDGGAVAVGVVGGLLGGVVLGSAMASRPYYAPAPVYAEPAPPPLTCYWTRGRPYWDDWQGAWVRASGRVCEWPSRGTSFVYEVRGDPRNAFFRARLM